MGDHQKKVATVVRNLLRDEPALRGQYPQLRAQLHHARLGCPSPGMRRCLAQLDCLDAIGKPRQRLSVGLITLEPGVTIQVQATGRQGTVATVQPYPLHPEQSSAEPAVYLANGDCVTWGEAIAIVQRCDGTPVPPYWEYTMEHETAGATYL